MIALGQLRASACRQVPSVNLVLHACNSMLEIWLIGALGTSPISGFGFTSWQFHVRKGSIGALRSVDVVSISGFGFTR